jgi:CheY-like chemotaxis protein
MAEGGRLEIELANETVVGGDVPDLVPGRYLRLAVRDFGNGIGADVLGRIFDPYFTTKAKGSGLGLATVHSIVKRHGGKIDVDSVVGRGTCFRVWLPAVGGSNLGSASAVQPVINVTGLPATNGAFVRASAELAAPTLVMSGAQRVLVMDDESSIRRVAEAVLRRAGYDVTVVSDGTEAVREYTEARAAGRGFALVIFDLTVPEGMGGRQALVELQKIDPAVRAIVSSGYSSDASLADHLKLGFAAMVAKPYEAATLITAVRAVLKEGAA